jgi:hypothetical protein
MAPRTGSSRRIESPLASLRTSEARNVSMWLLSSPGRRYWTLHNYWPELSWRCIRSSPKHQTPSHNTSTSGRSWAR